MFVCVCVGGWGCCIFLYYYTSTSKKNVLLHVRGFAFPVKLATNSSKWHFIVTMLFTRRFLHVITIQTTPLLTRSSNWRELHVIDRYFQMMKVVRKYDLWCNSRRIFLFLFMDVNYSYILVTCFTSYQLMMPHLIMTIRQCIKILSTPSPLQTRLIFLFIKYQGEIFIVLTWWNKLNQKWLIKWI